jgi:hypothetical protein
MTAQRERRCDVCFQRTPKQRASTDDVIVSNLPEWLADWLARWYNFYTIGEFADARYYSRCI